jgi:hypothetical protein
MIYIFFFVCGWDFTLEEAYIWWTCGSFSFPSLCLICWVAPVEG